MCLRVSTRLVYCEMLPWEVLPKSAAVQLGYLGWPALCYPCFRPCLLTTRPPASPAIFDRSLKSHESLPLTTTSPKGESLDSCHWTIIVRIASFLFPEVFDTEENSLVYLRVNLSSRIFMVFEVYVWRRRIQSAISNYIFGGHSRLQTVPDLYDMRRRV